MNESDQSALPPMSAIDSSADEFPWPSAAEPSKPLSWWLRKLFACNPFYLVSAALLLYSCHLISIDAPFLSGESARLVFNFSSVQFYELMLIGTALFLARRALWYDSTLLVGLENLLVFVPFILSSQAAFIDSRMALAMSVASALAALYRFSALKRFFAGLNLPGRLLGAGFILLVLNAVLPLIYRHFGETKIGVYIDAGPAYEMNECTWLLILPAMLALANFLPWAGGAGTLPHQHRWLPDGLFALWILATGVHVYSLDYIYQFDLRPDLLAPAAWVFTWTLWLCFTGGQRRLRTALIAAAVLVPLLAMGSGRHHTFLILTALNLAACLANCLAHRSQRVAQHLLFAATLVFLAAVPNAWIHLILPRLTAADCVIGSATMYLLFWMARSRNPQVGVFVSILAGCAAGSLLNSGDWAFQAGLIFLLLHSLRWNDAAHVGAKAVRLLTGTIWVAHSFFWAGVNPGHWWMPCATGLLTLMIYAIAQLFSGKWNHPSVPGAALWVILSGPNFYAVEYVRTLPAGLLAVIGSFLLFGLGTIAALTRSRWHKSETSSNPESPLKTSSNS